MYSSPKSIKSPIAQDWPKGLEGRLMGSLPSSAYFRDPTNLAEFK